VLRDHHHILPVDLALCQLLANATEILEFEVLSADELVGVDDCGASAIACVVVVVSSLLLPLLFVFLSKSRLQLAIHLQFLVINLTIHKLLTNLSASQNLCAALILFS